MPEIRDEQARSGEPDIKSKATGEPPKPALPAGRPGFGASPESPTADGGMRDGIARVLRYLGEVQEKLSYADTLKKLDADMVYIELVTPSGGDVKVVIDEVARETSLLSVGEAVLSDEEYASIIDAAKLDAERNLDPPDAHLAYVRERLLSAVGEE